MTFVIANASYPAELAEDLIESHAFLLYNSHIGRSRGLGEWVTVPKGFVGSMQLLCHQGLVEWSGTEQATYRPKAKGIPLFEFWRRDIRQ